jgi:hypothetical protein
MIVFDVLSSDPPVKQTYHARQEPQLSERQARKARHSCERRGGSEKEIGSLSGVAVGRPLRPVRHAFAAAHTIGCQIVSQVPVPVCLL